jgi:hypothetical protein
MRTDQENAGASAIGRAGKERLLLEEGGEVNLSRLMGGGGKIESSCVCLQS